MGHAGDPAVHGQIVLLHDVVPAGRCSHGSSGGDPAQHFVAARTGGGIDRGGREVVHLVPVTPGKEFQKLTVPGGVERPRRATPLHRLARGGAHLGLTACLLLRQYQRAE